MSIHKRFCSGISLYFFAPVIRLPDMKLPLGPTLFLIFINVLPQCFEYCKSDLYADDATVHDENEDVDTIEKKFGMRLRKCC